VEAMEVEEGKEELGEKTTMKMFSDYYELFFPYTEITNWLSYYSPPKEDEYNEYFKNREFSFTLEGDIYIRYQSFNNAIDLKTTLIQKNPVKIDIGAVFNLQPKYNKQYKKAEEQTLTPLEKELVFDIDMTDYDSVRTCCQNTKICEKCWKFIKIAYEIMNLALREDFGFKNLLWVYSGRRGIHCWVCDHRARKLSNECRESIVNYLSVYAGNDTSEVRPNISWPLHYSLKRASKILEKYIKTIMEEQKLLENEKHCEMLLKFLSDQGI